MKNENDDEAEVAATDEDDDNYDDITRQLCCYKSIQQGIRFRVFVTEECIKR
jgi:hypothetical protein